MLNKLKKLRSSLYKLASFSFAAILFATPVSVHLHAAEDNSIVTEDTSSKAAYSATKSVAAAKLMALTEYYGATSVQYALIDDGKIVATGESGVYSKTNNNMLSKDVMYGIGSISKMYVTASVMQLVDQGKIDLDEPLTTYIPSFKMADKRYKKITPRTLLNHSSGLLGFSPSSVMLLGDNDTINHDTFLKQLETQRLKAEPGAFSVYCNDGFTLAEILVEKVSGMTFTDYVAKYISQPLNLKKTKTPLDKFPTISLAKTYNGDSKVSLPQECLNAIGTGGMYATAEELCRFATTFMKDSNDLITDQSRKALQNKEYLNGIWMTSSPYTSGYGLGWDTVDAHPFNEYGITALTKGGDTVYYHGSLIVLPDENMAVAVLSSGGASTYAQVAGQEILLAALKETGRIKEIKPYKEVKQPVQKPMPSDLKKYAGIYANSSMASEIKITDDGILTVANALMPTQTTRLIYTGDNKFTTEDGSVDLGFYKEKNGLTYTGESMCVLLPGLGEVVNASYTTQKLSDNPTTAKAEAAWRNRNMKTYFLVNDKYSSAMYQSGPLARMAMLEQLKGYVFNASIVDESLAKTDLNIPGSASRDLSDYYMVKQNGIEYLHSNGMIFTPEDSLKTLSSKSKFNVKIGTDGYAKWYKIGKKSANKKVTIKLPKESSYVIYNNQLATVSYSITNKSHKVTLPKDGYIVFLGSPKAQFTVSY